MHSFLITGKTSQDRQDYAKKFLEEKGVSYTVVLEPEGESIGIEAVKNLKKDLVRIQADRQGRGVLVKNAEKLTEEAANTLLKTLEEPPAYTTIILITPFVESIPETIASRCQVINLGVNIKLAAGSVEKLQHLLAASVGERLAEVEKYSNRKDALDFITSQMVAARHLLLQQTTENSTLDLLVRLEQTRKDLEANVNPKLTLTELLLNYPDYPKVST